MPELTTYLVDVFGAGPGGGNPAPIVLDAAGMSDDAMRRVAQEYGHESGFVLPAPPGSDADYALRFWVPNHEMSMCGHATVGAVWLLDHLSLLSKHRLRLHTASGAVEAVVTNPGTDARTVEISQPVGIVEPLLDPDLRAALADVLGLEPDDLSEGPLQNAQTSRVKTLIPLRSVSTLDSLTPDFSRIHDVCEAIGSTGLYPYAIHPTGGLVDARQFPKSSGYPEDAATGIAAAALAFGLLEQGLTYASGDPLRIRQGRAMGRPSEIQVRFEHDGSQVVGCWIGGTAQLQSASK